MNRSNFLLLLLGLASLVVYLAALGLADLRLRTIEFEVAFFAVFALYLAAVAIILRHAMVTTTRATWWIIIGFALLFRSILLPTRPTLSDDMFRYVWDGRVQANGFSPYRYPPDAQELAGLHLNDRTVWPSINRKSAITIYPPGAQLAYAGSWHFVGDSVAGFKGVFVIAELIGAWLLVRLLRALDQPPERVLIYLWSPLLVFEVAQAGHVDGLMLPFLILVLYARVRDRPWLLGVSLGLATSIKLFPVLLLPALLPLNWHDLRAAFKTAIGFALPLALGYFLYAVRGANPLGFLPQYFGENFNLGLAHPLFEIAGQLKVPGSTLVDVVTFGGLAILSLLYTLRPAASGRTALLRCVWIIGWFTLTTQNLFAWYVVWLLPLIAPFVSRGRLLGFKVSAMSAWLFFSGLIALSYLFFIHWRPISMVQVAEFVPLYALLALSGVNQVRLRLTNSALAVRWFHHDVRPTSAA
jgi:alpha-1,6-mannosyltransferase